MATYSERDISIESVFILSGSQSSCPLDDDQVILDTENNFYYGLESVAASIWRLVQQEPISLRKIVEKLCEEYEVDPKQCQYDSSSFILEMLNKQLIVIETPVDSSK